MMTLTLTLRRENGVIECSSTITVPKEKAPVDVFATTLRAAEEAAAVKGAGYGQHGGAIE